MKELHFNNILIFDDEAIQQGTLLSSAQKDRKTRCSTEIDK
jgi:hypothetical protein